MNDTKCKLLWLVLVIWGITALAFPVMAQERIDLAHNVLIQKKLGTSHRVTGSVGGFGGPESVTAAAGPAYVRTVTGSCSSSSTLVISGVEYLAGNLVLIAVAYSESSATVSSIVDNATPANTWTVLGHNLDGNSVRTTHAYGIISTGGTQNITITFSGSPTAQASASVFSGTFSSPLDENAQAPASISEDATYSIATDGTLAQAVEIVFVSVWNYSGAGTSNHDSGDGFSEVSDTGGLGVQYKITSANTALTVNGSKTSDYWLSVLTSYKAS